MASSCRGSVRVKHCVLALFSVHWHYKWTHVIRNIETNYNINAVLQNTFHWQISISTNGRCLITLHSFTLPEVVRSVILLSCFLYFISFIIVVIIIFPFIIISLLMRFLKKKKQILMRRYINTKQVLY